MNLQTRIGSLTRLGQSKSAVPDADQLDVYLELLTDAPDELLRSACMRLAKAQTYGFPTAADILAMCDTVRRDQIAQVKALPAHHDESDRRTWVHCQHCQDDPSAWLPPMWCQGKGHGFVAAVNAVLKISTCGNHRPHTPHSFTERCVCHMAAWRNDTRLTRLAEDTRRARA